MVVKAFETITLARVDDGANGIPGKPGTDGKTPYFHIAYSDSSDGRTNFSLDTPGSRKYIGSYTDFTQADNTNPADYNWQLVQGPQGPQGVPGSQNVPMTYVQTAQPTGNIVKDSLWWVGATMSSVTALKRWNGSSWIPETISQAVLNVVSLNAVKITGSTFASANSRVIANGEEELYTVGTTLTNTQTLDKMGYTSVAQGSIMGDTTPNSFKATTTISNTGSIRSRADFASGGWSIITIDPTQSAMTMSNSQNTSGTLNVDYLSRVNNCGKKIWTGTLVMNDAQSVTPTLKMSQCLNGWALLWSVFYGNGQNNDSRWFYQYISKNFVEAHSGQGITMAIAAPNGSTNWANNATKYLYFTDSTIKGYTGNNQQTGYSYALREVVAW